MRRGVVAASAGNHAQGVAKAARGLGIATTVFMPVGAPLPKLAATRAYGAEIVTVGSTIDDALVAATEFSERTGAVLIHPFDHEDIVVGQGTIGLEILDQVPDVRTVLVCTGGGGLVAGIATVMGELAPDVRVIGVQAAQAAAYPASLAAGHPVALERMSTMADGIAVGRPGVVPLAIIAERHVEIRTVSEDSLSRGLLLVLERSKLLVEPAGAAGVAALLEDATGIEPPVVVVLSGGNVDPLLLARVLEHGLVAAGRYLQLRVRISDRPGGLAALLAEVAALAANVISVEHLRTIGRALGRRGRRLAAPGDPRPRALRAGGRRPAGQRVPGASRGLSSAGVGLHVGDPGGQLLARGGRVGDLVADLRAVDRRAHR